MSHDLTATIGQNIHEYRQKAGMTQAELAEAVDAGSTFISRVKRGGKPMK